eukprot:jgi/Mesvir1/13043/Mv06033-RA.2
MGVPIAGRHIKHTPAHNLEGLKGGTSLAPDARAGVILKITNLGLEDDEDSLIGQIQRRAGRVAINTTDKGRPQFVEILRPINIAFLYFTTAADMVFAGKAIKSSGIWERVKAANGSMAPWGETTRNQLKDYMGMKKAKEHSNRLPFRPWQDECPKYREKKVCIDFEECKYNHTLELTANAAANPTAPESFEPTYSHLSRLPSGSSILHPGSGGVANGHDAVPNQPYSIAGPMVANDGNFAMGQQAMPFYPTQQFQQPGLAFAQSYAMYEQRGQTAPTMPIHLGPGMPQYAPYPDTGSYPVGHPNMMDYPPAREDMDVDMDIEPMEDHGPQRAYASTDTSIEAPLTQDNRISYPPPPPPLPPPPPMPPPPPDMMLRVPGEAAQPPAATVVSMQQANGHDAQAMYIMPTMPVMPPMPSGGPSAEPPAAPVASMPPRSLQPRLPRPQDYEIGEAVWRGTVVARSEKMQQWPLGRWTFRPAGPLPYSGASCWPHPLVLSPRKLMLKICMDFWDRAPYEARRLFYILAEPESPPEMEELKSLMKALREQQTVCVIELLEPGTDLYVILRDHASTRKLVPLCPMPPCPLVGLVLPRM